MPTTIPDLGTARREAQEAVAAWEANQHGDWLAQHALAITARAAVARYQLAISRERHAVGA